VGEGNGTRGHNTDSSRAISIEVSRMRKADGHKNADHGYPLESRLAIAFSGCQEYVIARLGFDMGNSG